MAARNPQTMAKRAREQAVRERRERKQAKKAEAAAAHRAAKNGEPPNETLGDDDSLTPAASPEPPPYPTE
jgi:hypothetical protein